MKNIIVFFFAALLFVGCGKNEEGDILSYIENNGLTGYESTPEGVYYKINNAGDTSMKPKIGEQTIVHYKGYYTDGEQFDSSYDRGTPFTTELVAVIAGWRVALPLFGEGGSGTIIIPPSLGYGENPTNGIRENAILVFDIEILEVQ
jgi:FKBP-type peptidyl-prolyl cis-trans isomerase FkpA/FKBP-type peptidyl-prolyl cis-trans isomerase FklB